MQTINIEIRERRAQALVEILHAHFRILVSSTLGELKSQSIFPKSLFVNLQIFLQKSCVIITSFLFCSFEIKRAEIQKLKQRVCWHSFSVKRI